jgi:hypothetical protein
MILYAENAQITFCQLQFIGNNIEFQEIINKYKVEIPKLKQTSKVEQTNK